MIRLTRINHAPLVVNADLIEHVEVTPDTVISLTTGQKFMVLESADEVIGRVIAYRRSINDCQYMRQYLRRLMTAAAPGGEEQTDE